ncbi:MAG TPA: aldolase/citrate lyase family protein [Verrucomicrobiae bacterium]|nr:aldolase/citrate lyase family protein [Verrucomicrobiae bacterium]
MNNIKSKLLTKTPVLGGWLMTGSPNIGEIMADAGFDFIVVDMEHTPTNGEGFYQIILSAKGTGCGVFARLASCDPVAAKQVLDMGAAGIIVPSVNSPDEAAQAVAMAKFPPEGIRGASFCRASGFGHYFQEYFQQHNKEVLVVIMLESIVALRQIEAILSTPGIDAALIGPYDLSASMGLAGKLDNPDVVKAQQRILSECSRKGIPAGIHVVSVDPNEVLRRVNEGFRFIACGMDTLFIREGCRQVLQAMPQIK